MTLPDTYTLKARIAPVVTVIALPTVSAFLFVNPGNKASWLAAPAIAVALWALTSLIGRGRGKKLENGLFEKWGGPPTTQLLRYRSTTLPREQLQTLHAHFAKESFIRVPDETFEDHLPEEADIAFAAITRHMRDATRGTKAFPLVFDELCNYGFVRNLYGLRRLGVWIGLLSAAVAAGYIALTSGWPPDYRAAAIALNLVSAAIWLFWPAESSVRMVAESYADRLISAGLQIVKRDRRDPAEKNSPEPSSREAAG